MKNRHSIARTRTAPYEIDEYGNRYGGGTVVVCDCELCEKEVDEDETSLVMVSKDLNDEKAETEELRVCRYCNWKLKSEEPVNGWFGIF